MTVTVDVPASFALFDGEVIETEGCAKTIPEGKAAGTSRMMRRKAWSCSNNEERLILNTFTLKCLFLVDIPCA